MDDILAGDSGDVPQLGRRAEHRNRLGAGRHHRGADHSRAWRDAVPWLRIDDVQAFVQPDPPSITTQRADLSLSEPSLAALGHGHDAVLAGCSEADPSKWTHAADCGQPSSITKGPTDDLWITGTEPLWTTAAAAPLTASRSP